MSRYSVPGALRRCRELVEFRPSPTGEPATGLGWIAGGALCTLLIAMSHQSNRLDKAGQTVRAMFAAVAPRYDFLNHLLSVSLDRLWRRHAAVRAASENGLLLDLCCGTGDQAAALYRRCARVVAADFCLPMLAMARKKFRGLGPNAPAGLAADALALPLRPGSVGGATVSFGLRNVAQLDSALRQLYEVLRPGGRLVILEFAIPRQPLLRRLYLFYFQRLLPGIGRLISQHDAAYQYLSDSVPDFPQRQVFLQHLESAGFADLSWRDLSGGVVCLYTARRAT